MNFSDVVKRLKKIPFDEIRREQSDYFEFVVSTRYLIHLYPILEDYYGVPFKPSGIQPTQKAQDVTKNYGGIQQQQTLYYKKTDDVTDCAMIWPWNDGSRSTVKMAQGIIEAS